MSMEYLLLLMWQQEDLTFLVFELLFTINFHIQLKRGRTARAFSDGCSIALVSPNDASKFATLCKSFSKETFQRFPVAPSCMPAVRKRFSCRQIDKILRKDSQEKAKKSWLERNAESTELILEDNDSEEERMNKQKKATSVQLKTLQQERKMILPNHCNQKHSPIAFLLGLVFQLSFITNLKNWLGRNLVT